MDKPSIKVCGNTQIDNIQSIDDFGVDYLGFIFYKKSPRLVDFDLGHRVKNTHTKRIGVFVDASDIEMNDAIEVFNLDGIQFHGDESVETICKYKQKGLITIKAFRIHDDFDFNPISVYESVSDFFLWDTASAFYGGSGQKFNWAKLDEYALDTPFWLSGGIGQNDIQAIKSLNHPQFKGIDLNSGFEIKPGIKNLETLNVFINQINA